MKNFSSISNNNEPSGLGETWPTWLTKAAVTAFMILTLLMSSETTLKAQDCCSYDEPNHNICLIYDAYEPSESIIILSNSLVSAVSVKFFEALPGDPKNGGFFFLDDYYPIIHEENDSLPVKMEEPGDNKKSLPKD